MAGRRYATHLRRHDGTAAELLSGARTRGTGTADVDGVHVRAPARQRSRDQELPGGHTVHSVSAGTVAVRVLPGRHPGGQLHVAQHVPRASLEVSSQPRRVPTGRRPAPGLRPAVRRFSTRRTSLRVYR